MLGHTSWVETKVTVEWCLSSARLLNCEEKSHPESCGRQEGVLPRAGLPEASQRAGLRPDDAPDGGRGATVFRRRVPVPLQRRLEPALRPGLPAGARAGALPAGLRAERAHLAPADRLLLAVLGWILIAVVIIVLLIFTSVNQCLSPVSFMQLKFWKIYVEQEQRIFKSQATEHATELAKENVKCFFEGSEPKELNTPSTRDWEQISSIFTFNPKEQFYSMLHKYVNREEKNQSIHSKEGDAVIPILGFVDTPGMHTTAEL